MTIIIPAYEPDKKLLTLIRDIRENSDYDIIIVDDGSSENCKFISSKAEKEGCTVLTHKVNLGKGAALKTAFKYVMAKGEEAEGVVCADCDGQHTLQDILKIAKNILWHDSSIILGTRQFTGSVPLGSLIGNVITKYVFYFVTGSKIEDTQTGLRGYSVEMLPWLLEIKGNRYEYEMNQLLEAKPSGYDLVSIPIKTIYENQNNSSHFRPVVDSIKIYIPILKFSLSSFSCGIIDFISLFILNWLTHNLFISVVGARVFSSFYNYMLNRNMMFKATGHGHSHFIFKYYSLVAVILICNYLIIYIYTNVMNLPLLASKIMTESILFFVNYHTQREYLFSSWKKQDML